MSKKQLIEESYKCISDASKYMSCWIEATKEFQTQSEKLRTLVLFVSQCAEDSPALENARQACKKYIKEEKR